MTGQWRTKFESIFFVLVLFTPLITFPFANIPIEIVKTIWFWTVVQSWFWLRLATDFSSLQLFERRRATLWLWIVVVGIESIFLGGNAFWGGWWRRQGWWFMVHLGMAYSLASTMSASVGERFVKRMILIITLGIVLMGFANFEPARLSGTIGEANTWGLFGAISLVLLLENKKLRVLALASFAGIILSRSRAVMVAFLSVGLVRINPWIKITLIVFFMALILWFSLERGFGERGILWQETVALWSRSPWIGIGLENFQGKFTTTLSSLVNWSKYDQPHNLPLWILVSSGSIGLGLFAGWIFEVFRFGVHRAWRDLAILILVFSLFQPLLTPAWVYLVVVLGMLARDGSKTNNVTVSTWLTLVVFCLGLWIWWNTAVYILVQYL